MADQQQQDDDGSTESNVAQGKELNPDALFDAFILTSELRQTLDVFSRLCASVNIDRNDNKNVFTNLKAKLTSWKCQTLWKKLDKRAELDTYKKKPCAKTNALVLGCGPCGLRFAIEAALLGANVVVCEKRDCFSRNNVLHLWPFLIYDLKNLGAKKFFGRFCAGTLDHISIRRLQLILLKVALILGVRVYAECLFVCVKEPSEEKGWTAEIKPENHPASKFEFDVIMGTDGRRHTLKGFRRKEFRGKLAIAITMNFVNRNTKAEASVEEISGVAFIFNQGFFTDLKDETGIDLENIVYYKDETHYFVMTAKKKSLLLKGVLKKDLADPRDLLANDNVDRECLLQYAREAAYFCTNKQLPHMDFAMTPHNEEDIAMFDFTSMYAAENAAMILEMKGRRLLMSLAGDSLMEPFWPTGSGCARGFLAVFDAAWMMRGWGLGHSPMDLIMEREGIYKLLAQTTASSISKNYDDYTIDPRSRYPNATIRKAPKDNVRHLYKMIENSLEEVNKPTPMETNIPNLNIKDRVSPDLLLSWCQKHTKGYKNVHIKDMSASWKNGLGFCALIHKFRPDLINVEHLNEDDVEKNNALAFSVAEKEFGIPPQISASEMANNEKTDILTIVTYLAQIYETFKDEKPASPSSPTDEKSPDNYKSPRSKLSVMSRISMKTKKDKRKHHEERADVEKKSSKKYKVAEESKTIESPKDVELKSYKALKQSNGELGVTSKPPLQLATGKSGKTIGELAELVFGEQPMNRPTKASTPIRSKRGSQGDSEHCHFCRDKIFVFERLSAEGFFFHRKCFKCEHCDVTLRLGNYGYVPPEEGTPGRFYCKQHYRKIFYETPGKSPSPTKEDAVEIAARHQPTRRSHSIANIDVSRHTRQVEKTIDLDNDNDEEPPPPSSVQQEVKSPPKKVLKVPQKLRDEITKDRPSPNSYATRNFDVSPEICDVSLQSGDTSLEKSSDTPSRVRQPVYHKYSKYEAKPLRRSSISTTRKSDKGTRRLFVQQPNAQARAQRQKAKSPEPPKDHGIVLSPEAPPKPPRAHEMAKDSEDIPEVDEGNGKHRRGSKRAMYPPSVQFPDSFLVTKAISLDEDTADQGGEGPDRGNVSRDLRECLGESTPRQVGRYPSTLTGQAIDPKKHWTTYYRTAGSFGTPQDSGDMENFTPDDIEPTPSPPTSPDYLEEPPARTLTTLHEDREMSPTSPRKSWWPAFLFGGGQKKEKKSKEEKVKEKKLKEKEYKEHKKEKKGKKKKRKGKKTKDRMERERENEVEEVDGIPSEDEEDGAISPSSEVDSPGYYESSEDEDLPEAIRMARAREKRFKVAEEQRQLERQKKCEEFHIRLEMRQRQQKRLRIAQSIQRELDEVEVRQMELEKLGVIVEKKMERVESGNPREEQRLVLEWFELVNRKNTLIRYESELVIHSNSIELEDQQQRLEQQVRELLITAETSEEDQIKIDQLTRELVDIVEQRNTLVELLEHDRRREQEEDEVFEMMMASKGISFSS